MSITAETDKRKFPRADARFIVSYGRISYDAIVDRDVSQTRNISEAGAAFTTSRPFAPQTNLMLTIKLPQAAQPVQVTGTVLESKEISPRLVYFTRVNFAEIDDQKRRAIQQTVDHYARRNRPQQ
jgi:hypothetical protein